MSVTGFDWYSFYMTRRRAFKFNLQGSVHL